MTRLQFARYVEPAFLGMFLAGLALLANEAYWLENTIYGDRLFWLSLSVGCVTGFLPAAIFGWFHHKLLSGLLRPIPRTIRFAATSALSVGFLLPGVASYVNRTYVLGTPHRLDVTIAEKALGGRSACTPYLFFSSSSNNTERIEVDMEFYRGASVGETISLRLERGYFGFDVVRSWGHARVALYRAPFSGSQGHDKPVQRHFSLRWAR